MSKKLNNTGESTSAKTCEYWVNLGECVFRDLSDPEPLAPAIYCGKPAKFSRKFPDGATEALCLRHRIYLLQVHILVTIEDWIQDHIKHDSCWCGWFHPSRK